MESPVNRARDENFRTLVYEHSEKARAQYKHGQRDEPRCGALGLLHKPLHYRDSSEFMRSFV